MSEEDLWQFAPCLLPVGGGSTSNSPLRQSPPPHSMAQQSVHVRQAAKYLSRLRLTWSEPAWPTHFLIAHKDHDPSLISALEEILEFLLNETPAGDSTIVWLPSTLRPEIYGPRIKYWSDQCPDSIDLIITAGGDGTLLTACWLFQTIVPPVVPFHAGTVGFLNNFSLHDHRQVLQRIIHGCRVNIRMRLQCEIRGRVNKVYQVLNEVMVDRGTAPMTTLDILVEGERMTTVQADGLIVATPTGSTAYSMSAGGPVAHPEVPAIIITPICPHTLSFRPLILPDSIDLVIQLNPSSRGTAWASFDGRDRLELEKGDKIIISSSNYPVPTVCKEDQTHDWFNGLARCLHWNDRPSAGHL